MPYVESEADTTVTKLEKIIALKGEARECVARIQALKDVEVTPAIPEIPLVPGDPNATPPIPDIPSVPEVPAVMGSPQYVGRDVTNTERDERYDYWKGKADATIAKAIAV